MPVYRLIDEPIIVAELPHLITYENTRTNEALIRQLRKQITGKVYLICDFSASRIELRDAALMMREAMDDPTYFWYDPQLMLMIVAHFAVANLLHHTMLQIAGSTFTIPIYETLADALEQTRSEIAASTG